MKLYTSSKLTHNELDYNTTYKRILIAAGEASGDLHAAHLLSAMRTLFPHLYCYGMGGEKLKEAGAHIVFDIAKASVIGITEVISHLSYLYRIYSWFKDSLRRDHPDLIILVDYPDFNLRLAKVAKRHQVPVLYYISPQVWAWRSGRITQIGKWVDKIIVLFPFELPLYQREGIKASFVGHPLLDIVKVKNTREENLKRFGLDQGKITIALLPGSRLSEVKRILPLMVGAAQKLSSRCDHLQFIVPIAPGLKRTDIVNLTKNNQVPIILVENSIYEVIDCSYIVVVASGTATLETALLSTPMVIVYKMSPLSFWIGKRLVKVPYIGMANIIAGKKVVPELVQTEATPDNIVFHVNRLLEDEAYHQQVRKELSSIREKLGEPGASTRAAQIALEMLTH